MGTALGFDQDSLGFLGLRRATIGVYEDSFGFSGFRRATFGVYQGSLGSRKSGTS